MLTARTGEPLNFSRLAEAAQVSRRTLYTHWGTVERVIGDAIAVEANQSTFDTAGLGPRAILSKLLHTSRERLNDPATHIGLTGLIAQAATDARAAEALEALGNERLGEYKRLLGIDDFQKYSQIVGPLVFSALVLSKPITDEFIDAQIDVGMQLLGVE
jgi:AcrR family transcriptional regulator